MEGLRIALTTSRSPRERYYLLKDGRGMGGAGEPPEHHSHSWVVVNGVDRGNGYQGYMSVDYALSDEVTWLPESAKRRIRLQLGLED